MSNFNQTLSETKRCFSYDVNRKQQKTFCKNKSIERFNRTVGRTNNTDIHGLLWDERAILEVVSIDYDVKKAVVKNCNGLEWIMDLKNITFCYQNGNRIK